MPTSAAIRLRRSPGDFNDMDKFALVTSITLGRAPLVLAGCAFSLANLAAPHPAWVAAAGVALALSAVTDAFDGALARKWGATSRLGALADPLMDKVFYLATLPTATFVALWSESVGHAAMLLALDVVSLLRDQWVSFLRAVGSEYGADVRASLSGKIRTIIGFPAIVFVHVYLGIRVLGLVRPDCESLAMPGAAVPVALEAVLLAVTVWSGVDYTRRFAPFLKRAAERG